jgi:phage FluMu protein Com
MEEKQKLICDKCQVEMVELEVEFSYLNRSFRHKVPRCPECGQVYISEELAKGRMRDVEKNLEEK